MGWARIIVAMGIVLASAGAPALAQDDATERELERYRQMLKDDPWSNPAMLDADRGEALWKEKRRPEGRVAGGLRSRQGQGKVDGAFAELPRYFADADRVMDMETRIVWCMEKLQGLDRADILKRPYSKANQQGTEMEALATYVAVQVAGLKYAPPLDHAKEKETLALGEALFFRRQGPMDFCLRDLPRRSRAGASACRPLPYLEQARGSAQGGRRVAGLSPVAGHGDDHAAPHRRLLLADARCR